MKILQNPHCESGLMILTDSYKCPRSWCIWKKHKALHIDQTDLIISLQFSLNLSLNDLETWNEKHLHLNPKWGGSNCTVWRITSWYYYNICINTHIIHSCMWMEDRSFANARMADEELQPLVFSGLWGYGNHYSPLQRLSNKPLQPWIISVCALPSDQC